MLEEAWQLLKSNFDECCEIVKGNKFYYGYALEKWRHSKQVAGAGNYIISKVEWLKDKSAEYVEMVRTAVLLHDVCRFTEITYRYNGGDKYDHGVEAAAFLKQIPLFNDIRIWLPIKHHGHRIEYLYNDDEYKNIITSIINVNGSHDDLNSIRDLLLDIPESMEALEQLDEILTVVEAFGFDDYTVKLSIARGLDYYTGVVFEIYVPKLGAQKQITGGGTYKLTSLFDSEDVESTGFAFGFDRIMEAFHKQKLEVEEDNYNKVLVVPIKKEFKMEAIKVAQLLRNADIITDIDLKGKKLKKNLSFANSNNINNVVLIGAQEVEDGTVTLKHMDSKEQVTIPRDELVDNILNG